MSDKQKNATKILMGLLAILAGGGAAAEGYTPDFESLSRLGLLGAAALIAYFHFVWLPIARGGDAKLDAILAHVTAAQSANAVPVEESSRASGPVLAVVKQRGKTP